MNETIILTPDGPMAARSVEASSGRVFVLPIGEEADGWENPGAAAALARLIEANPETREEYIAIALGGEAILPVVEADAALDVVLAEAGRRNSAKDESTMRQIVSLIKSLGVSMEVDDGEADVEVEAKEADVEIEERGKGVGGVATKCASCGMSKAECVAEGGECCEDCTHGAVAKATKATKVAALPEVPDSDYAEAIVDDVPPAQITFREGSIDADNMITLAEAAARFDDEARTVYITPIKPGWGNKRDNRFYPTTTLEVATREGKFDNLKMFADHPRKSEEKDLPERSVKDWVATTREAEWDSVRQRPIVPLVVHDQAVYQRFKEAPEQIAFSVLGSGVAKPGEVGGKKGTIVESIAKLRSVDWVTEAGAGGALDFAEAASEEFEMNLADMTTTQVAALQESNPALYKHLIGLAKAMPDVASEEKAAAKAETAPGAVEGDGVVSAKEADVPEWARPLVAASMKATEDARLAEARVVAKAHVEEALSASTLPRAAKTAIRSQFAEAEGDISESVASTVALAESLFTKAAAQPLVTGLGAAPADGSLREASLREAEDRLAARFGATATPSNNQLVFSAEQLGGVSAPTGAASSDVAAKIHEASQDVQDSIAAKFG